MALTARDQKLTRLLFRDELARALASMADSRGASDQVAAACAEYMGLAASEVTDRKVRDLDDGGALLGVVATEVARSFVGRRPIARLVEDVDSDDKVIVVIARVALSPSQAIDALLAFTGTEWWARMVAATQGGIVVDVECI